MCVFLCLPEWVCVCVCLSVFPVLIIWCVSPGFAPPCFLLLFKWLSAPVLLLLLLCWVSPCVLCKLMLDLPAWSGTWIYSVWYFLFGLGFLFMDIYCLCLDSCLQHMTFIFLTHDNAFSMPESIGRKLPGMDQTCKRTFPRWIAREDMRCDVEEECSRVDCFIFISVAILLKYVQWICIFLYCITGISLVYLCALFIYQVTIMCTPLTHPTIMTLQYINPSFLPNSPPNRSRTWYLRYDHHCSIY